MTFRNQIRRAWEAGAEAPDGWGWDVGQVEPDIPHTPTGEGSQVPPARDRDGHPIDAGVASEDAHRVASFWLRKQAVSRSNLAGDARFIKDRGGKMAVQWTPERRLVDALTKGDTFLTHLNYLAREAPYAKRYIEKASKYLEIALQIAGRDIAREMGLPSVRYASARTASMIRNAGEVRFIKDQRGDGERWGWPPPGPGERNIGSDYKFDPTKIKPIASTLRSSLMALGHSLSAYQRFTKLKSATISPDGNLGGMGYILKITEIRQQYMNIVEALSSITDTLYDEVHAPHWNPVKEEQSPKDRKEVQDIMEDVEEIRNDPEDFAQEEEENMDSGNSKKASRGPFAGLQERQFPECVSDVGQFRIKRISEAYIARNGGLL